MIEQKNNMINSLFNIFEFESSCEFNLIFILNINLNIYYSTNKNHG